MLLISEEIHSDLIVESVDKDLFSSGIFMQSNAPNKNNRVYPKSILQRECVRYNQEKIAHKRSMGELNHPASPSVNLDKVSHLIVSLKESGNDFIGKAKILGTPAGVIAKNLIEGGVNLGVSTRGTGSMSTGENGVNIIQEDYNLRTVDIVAEPSAHSAFVDGIMEGVDWICDNGIFSAEIIDESKRKLDTAGTNVKPVSIEVFEKLMAQWSTK